MRGSSPHRCETAVVSSAGDTEPARHAAILAGGASTRMGTPKAAVELAGRPMIAHPIAAARAAGLEPFVVVKRASPLPDIDCPLVAEPDDPRHPLVGIVAALGHTGAPVVAIACDTPLVPPGLLGALAAVRAPFAMPTHPRPQPLVARYSPALLPRLRAALARGDSLTSTAADLGGVRLGEEALREFGDPDDYFANVNEPADADALAARMGS
jgi:molybdopterin-guanine dinucleotide biosynthesis protein A